MTSKLAFVTTLTTRSALLTTVVASLVSDDVSFIDLVVIKVGISNDDEDHIGDSSHCDDEACFSKYCDNKNSISKHCDGLSQY